MVTVLAVGNSGGVSVDYEFFFRYGVYSNIVTQDWHVRSMEETLRISLIYGNQKGE